jgi:peptidoglycan hydrolase-like protein with peptidoglycan-binding domain
MQAQEQSVGTREPAAAPRAEDGERIETSPDTPAALSATSIEPASVASAADAADAPSAPQSTASPASTASTVSTDSAASTANVSLDEFKRPDLTSAEAQTRAYAAAYARWNAEVGDLTPDVIPCDLAPRANLQCLGTTGTWQDIAEYDLPAVIELWDTGTTPFYGAVVGLEGDLVTLALGDKTLTLRTSTLANHWYGSFVVLWRTPPDYAGSIRPGDRHPTVAWVRETLADRDARAAASLDRSLFDQSLHDAVIAFQRDAGLPPDGVVGPSTWIALTRRSDASLPRLVSAGGRSADVPGT